MADKRTDINEVPIEAIRNANEAFGDVRPEGGGKRILGTQVEDKIVGLYEELQDAHIDPVTGLFSRVRWEGEMSRYFEVAKRDNEPFLIAMMDLDDFKAMNDLYGHQFGDEVLRKFGKAILGTFKSNDICGRYGGDEAIVMLPRTSMEPSAIVDEEKKLTLELTQKTELGVSIGIAKWDGRSPLANVIDEADKRLYQNKEGNKKKNV